MRPVNLILKTYSAFMRGFIILGLGCIVLFPILVKAESASFVSLNRAVTLEGNLIRLGDLFTGLERNQDKVLGVAPRPGTSMTLNARTLLRVARATDIAWRPVSTADQAVIKRAATVIDTAVITDTLRKALDEEGLSGKYEISYGYQKPQIVLPADQPARVDISALSFDRSSNIFEASLVAPSQDAPLQTLNIRGEVKVLVDVPVLKESLRHGAVIGKHDIEFVEIPKRSLKPDMLISADTLIGKTPRRMVLAGEPVKALDVEEPKIVGRGDIVTIIFKSGPLILTAQGKAMEHGARGDIIRVVNTASNKTLEAMVNASREVIVQPHATKSHATKGYAS